VEEIFGLPRPHELEQRMSFTDLFTAIGSHNQDGLRCEAGQQIIQKIYARRVGPLEIVQKDEKGLGRVLALNETQEKPGKSLEETQSLLLRGQRGILRQLRHAHPQLWGDLRDFRQPQRRNRLKLLTLELCQALAHSFAPRLIGELNQLMAVPLKELYFASLARVRDELLSKTRLAHAGLAADQDAASPTLTGLLQRAHEASILGPSPHKRDAPRREGVGNLMAHQRRGRVELINPGDMPSFNVLVEFLGLLAGLSFEFVELLATALVGAHRLAGGASQIIIEHELAPAALAIWVFF
jgi:hypothetical protein